MPPRMTVTAAERGVGGSGSGAGVRAALGPVTGRGSWLIRPEAGRSAPSVGRLPPANTHTRVLSQSVGCRREPRLMLGMV